MRYNLPMLNVLLITKDVNMLREGTVARKTLEEYSKLAKHIFVIVLNNRRDRYKIQKVSDTLWIYPTNSWVWWLSPFDAARTVKREVWFQGHLQADIISALDPCESGLAGARVAGFSDKPLQVHVEHDVFDPHFVDESFANKLRVKIARYVLPRATTIRAASERIRASLADFSVAVGDKAVMVPRFIDVEQLAKEPVRVNLHEKYPSFRFIILMIAPLINDQNLELALTVLQGVSKYYEFVGLVIVGEGPERKRLMARARKLGLERKVAFESSGENISSYYKTANVFLVTALYEEYGDTIAEAAACGIAIVASNVGIASTLIQHGDSGFLCNPQDAESFVKSIALIMQNTGIRERLRINSHLYFENHTRATRSVVCHPPAMVTPGTRLTVSATAATVPR